MGSLATSTQPHTDMVPAGEDLAETAEMAIPITTAELAVVAVLEHAAEMAPGQPKAAAVAAADASSTPAGTPAPPHSS